MSWDFLLAGFIALLLGWLLPTKIPLTIAKEVLGTSISILAIMFSVFFAALAIVITAGDNEFISFLEEDGMYSHIIWTYRVTLLLLFLALLSAIILYVALLPYLDQSVYPDAYFPELLMVAFAMLSLWALFAAFLSSFDSIKYARYRARFSQIMNFSIGPDSTSPSELDAPSRDTAEQKDDSQN